MSHLGKFTSSQNLMSTVEFSPEEYRKLNRRKNRWFIGAMLVTFGWLFMLTSLDISSSDNAWAVTQGLLVAAATLLMGWPILEVAVKAGEIRFDFVRSDTVKNRAFVLDVRKTLSEAAQRGLDWPKGASFTPEISVMKFLDRTHNDMLLRLVPSDPAMATHSYRVSPTRVTTVSGPNLQDIFDDVKRLLLVSDDFASADTAIGTTFQRVVPGLAEGEMAALQRPRPTASATELMGD